jgi:hypothetical protein
MRGAFGPRCANVSVHLKFAKRTNVHASRRQFLSRGAVIASGVCIAGTALADTPIRLLETDPTAESLGYKDDATKVDHAKFPRYAAPQACNNCALYQGKAGDASGPCPIYTGKLVQAKGWCNAYVKKG